MKTEFTTQIDMQGIPAICMDSHQTFISSTHSELFCNEDEK